MITKKFTVYCLILAIVFMFSACATKIVNFEDLTPKEKLTYMYQIYNAQHEDYMAMAANPLLTEAQKVVLRKKKPILVALQTLIPMYDRTVQSGTPSHTQEQQIYDLLSQIQGMVPQ